MPKSGKTRTKTTEKDFIRCEECEEELNKEPIMWPVDGLVKAESSTLPWGPKSEGLRCPRGHKVELPAD